MLIIQEVQKSEPEKNAIIIAYEETNRLLKRANDPQTGATMSFFVGLLGGR